MKTDYGAGGTGADPMAFPNDWHRAAITDFLDSLDEKREPVISGREALKVHRLIDALLEAGRTGATRHGGKLIEKRLKSARHQKLFPAESAELPPSDNDTITR